jgi:hypothetical protein
MAVIGEELEDYVINQINARQTLHGSGVGHTGTLRTDKQINLLNSNTSWIKLASGVSISGSNRLSEIDIPDAKIPNLMGMGLAKNNILFSGTSKLSSRDVFNSTTQKTEEQFFLQQREGFLPRDDNSSYTYGSFGFSPMPGIHSADIKTLTRGSLKKATVKLTANNKQQFDIIDLLYMRLGYTVLLEWGNSIYTTNGEDKEILRNTLTEEKFFESAGSDSYFTFLDIIENTRDKYKGNYDALLGKVSNFNWSFNADGSYDIELTIISLGDVVESLKSNLSVDTVTNNFLNTIDGKVNEESTVDEENSSADIITAMLAIYKFINNENSYENRISIKTSEIDPTTGAVGKKYPIGEFLNIEQKNGTAGVIKARTHKVQFSCIISGDYKIYFERSNDRWDTPQIENTRRRIRKDYVEYKSDSFSKKIYSEITELNDNEYTPEKRKALRKTFHDEMVAIKEAVLINKEINNSQLLANETFNTTTTDINTGIGAGVTRTDYEVAQIDEEDKKKIKIRIKKEKTIHTSPVTVKNPLTLFTLQDAFKLYTKETPNYYIRFGALLEFILNNVIIKIKNTNNDPIFDIDVDEDNTFMYSLPNQISLDPRVCLVRNDKFNTVKNGITNVFGNTDKLESFKLVDDGETNDNVAYPLNIYLNFNFILECLKADEKGNVSVYQLISNICTGLNKALGGINNLEPIIDETDNTLRIIDTTPIPGKYSAATNNSKYALQIYGYNKIDSTNKGYLGNDYISNFVRKVDLKTVIDPGYATMITVGATAGGYVKGTEATAFSKWNTGLIDRFKEELLPPDGTIATPNKDEAALIYQDSFLYTKQFPNRFGLTSLDLTDMKFSDNIIEKNISTVTEYYKWLIAKSAEGKDVSGGTVGFIPFKLGLTLDGISGIKIYNVLRVNTEFLPKAYGKTINLIVTGVSHRLNNNDWETSIETTVISKTIETALITITAEEAAETIKKIKNTPKQKGSTVGILGENATASDLTPGAFTLQQIKDMTAKALKEKISNLNEVKIPEFPKTVSEFSQIQLKLPQLKKK